MANPDPVDTAWRIHAALTDWTGKVDTKASFTLTIETAIMAGILALYGSGRALSGLQGWRSVISGTGVAMLAVAMLLAVLVVIPRLRRIEHLKQEAESGHFIYFGHSRHLQPDQISGFIENIDLLPVLAHQHQKMAEIAWKKHRFVQASMIAAISGASLVAIGALI